MQTVEIVALGDRLLVLDHAGGRFTELRMIGFACDVDNAVDNSGARASSSEKSSENTVSVLIKTASEFKTPDPAKERRRARNRRHYVRRRAGLCGLARQTPVGQTIKTPEADFKTYARVEVGKQECSSADQQANAGDARQPHGRPRQVLMDQAFAFVRKHRLLREAEIAALIERITENGRWERYLDRGTGAFLTPDREFFEQLFPMVQAERRREPMPTGTPPRQGWLKLPLATGGQTTDRREPTTGLRQWREAG